MSLGHVTGFPITFLRNLVSGLAPTWASISPPTPSAQAPEASHPATWPVGSRNLASAPLEPGRLYSLTCFLKFQASIEWFLGKRMKTW